MKKALESALGQGAYCHLAGGPKPRQDLQKNHYQSSYQCPSVYQIQGFRVHRHWTRKEVTMNSGQAELLAEFINGPPHPPAQGCISALPP